MQWLLEGNDEQQIGDAIENLYPGQSPSKILAGVMDKLQMQGQADPDVVRGWAIEATRLIYQKLVSIGDYANAMKAIAQIMKLAPPANVYNDTEEEAGVGET